MNTVTILGLNRVSNPKPNRGGSTVLAYFDCEANGLVLQGCAFVRTPKNGLTVWPPKFEGPESVRRSITFADDRLRQELARAAQSAYRALGGTYGEWMPQDPEGNERVASATGKIAYASTPPLRTRKAFDASLATRWAGDSLVTHR